MHGGFEVWLLNGCGPNLCFPKAFRQSTKFPRRKSDVVSPYFHDGKFDIALPQVSQIVTIRPEGGEQVYIYIHHAQCQHIEQESKCLRPQSIALPFLLALRRTCLSSILPRSVCLHAKERTRNQQTSNGKKKMRKAYERGIKPISMIDMVSRETRKQANKREGKQARKQIEGGVHEGQMQVQIECL